MADVSVFNKTQSISDYQRQKEALMMKNQLMRAQLAQAMQPPEVDVNKLGEKAFLKASQGMQLSPDEMAALKYIDAKQPTSAFNPVTGAMETKPSLLDRAGLYAQKSGGQMPSNQPAFTGTPMIPGATPKTIQKKQEMDVEEQAKREQGFTKAQSALQGFKQQSQLVVDTIDKAINTATKPGSLATGYGQALSSLPNTDARELNNYLNTIKANVGFDKLQQMRENSPTGGALGNVTENENKLLQAVNGALDPMQSGQLVQNLGVIKQLYPVVMQERERAFQQDYGMITPFGGNVQPVELKGATGEAPNYKSKYGLE